MVITMILHRSYTAHMPALPVAPYCPMYRRFVSRIPPWVTFCRYLPCFFALFPPAAVSRPFLVFQGTSKVPKLTVLVHVSDCVLVICFSSAVGSWGNITYDAAAFSARHIWRDQLSVCPVIGGAAADHWWRRHLPASSAVKVPFSLCKQSVTWQTLWDSVNICPAL